VRRAAEFIGRGGVSEFDQQELHPRKILGANWLTQRDFMYAEDDSGDAEAGAERIARAGSRLVAVAS
jgi:hypothetical protein